MSDFGLPEPVRELTEVDSKKPIRGQPNILMADFSELANTPIASAWNRCLQDLSDRLETLMSDFGLPEPVHELTEVDRQLLRWNRESCQQFVDAHLSLLSQRVIFDEVIDAIDVRGRLIWKG
jgi:hypothetical protein